MPKYFCDYCDTFLTHDTPSVRKTHNSGRKHRENVRVYYQQWLEEQAQKLVDATARAFRDTSVMRTAVGMVPPPMLIPGAPVPIGIPPPTVAPGAYMFPPAAMAAMPGMPPRPGVVAQPPPTASVPEQKPPLGAVPPMTQAYYAPRVPLTTAAIPDNVPMKPEYS